jgi:hypothetical protein
LQSPGRHAAPPHEEIRELYRQTKHRGRLIDNATASRLKTQFAAHLREQITLGIPTGQDEAGLRRLARQLRGEAGGGEALLALSAACQALSAVP